jgi:hypothetical protein
LGEKSPNLVTLSGKLLAPETKVDGKKSGVTEAARYPFFCKRNIELHFGEKKNVGSYSLAKQGCQIFHRQKTKIGSKITKMAMTRAARFFLVQTNQNLKYIPNDHKVYQTAMNYTKWP